MKAMLFLSLLALAATLLTPGQAANYTNGQGAVYSVTFHGYSPSGGCDVGIHGPGYAREAHIEAGGVLRYTRYHPTMRCLASGLSIRWAGRFRPVMAGRHIYTPRRGHDR